MAGKHSVVVSMRRFSLWSQNGILEATYIKLPSGNWAKAGILEPPITKGLLLSVGADKSELRDDHCRWWANKVAEIRAVRQKGQ